MKLFTSFFIFISIFLLFTIETEYVTANEKRSQFFPGEIWPDNNDVHINAHGGGISYFNNTYYWFGEHKVKGRAGNNAQVGVHCYSSNDLYNWKDEGIALSVSDDTNSDIAKGCILERPKVIYNQKTKKFVMWFHLELKGKGYNTARTGLAISDKVTGPYLFIKSLRPNAGYWPENFTPEQKKALTDEQIINRRVREITGDDFLVRRDFKGGQMSRDMTLFVDDDNKAYHIHASEENQTLHISQLSDDYLSFSGRYTRVFPGASNEAPAIFKRMGKYYMISSGCTGWRPNSARSAVADSIWGPWKNTGNPCVGINPQNRLGPEKTFGGQSTFVISVKEKQDAYIAMFDMWRPGNAIDGRYIWLPIKFTEDNFKIEWLKEWNLDVFKPFNGYKLVWSDEFNNNGQPDPKNWIYEKGFIRNEELQLYQPENAWCENGLLVIEARRELKINPNYNLNSNNWRRKRKNANYTSASLKTTGFHEWTYGRFEMRGRIDTRPGLWPAFWTLGSARGWPGCGEIDIMEYYRGTILANACWASNRRYQPIWDTVKKPITYFSDPDWSSKFHIWRMDWDKDNIKLYVDDELLNTIELSKTINDDRDRANPFHEPHHIILNLAIGGTNGGDPSETEFPARFEVDYVRVYEKL